MCAEPTNKLLQQAAKDKISAQNCSAIRYYGLTGAESFSHQPQIGWRDLGSFADSTNREAVASQAERGCAPRLRGLLCTRGGALRSGANSYATIS